MLSVGCFGITSSAGLLCETLEDVTFTDGGTARGEFIFNPGSDAITSWDIRVSGGDTTDFPPHTYNSSNSNIIIGAASYLGVDYTALFFESTSILPTGIQRRRDIRFLLEIPFPAAGGVDPFVIEDLAIIASLGSEAGFECFNCAPYRLFASGDIDGRAIPEPNPLIVFGTVAVGLLARRLYVTIGGGGGARRSPT